MNIFDFELKHVYRFKGGDFCCEYALWRNSNGKAPFIADFFLMKDDEFVVIETQHTERNPLVRSVKILGIHKELLGWLCAGRNIDFEEVLEET